MFLLLDSGAFSSWNVGKKVDLDEYIKYIWDNMEWVSAYVNLDVIPGEPGRVPTEQEVEQSAQQGWDNMLYMQGLGLDPIPVFHQGERFYWLERMLEHGCQYIGISPANDRSTDQKIKWLDRVFDRLTDDEGNAIVKTHSFGATSVRIVTRYPWHTVDSTSWLAAARYGAIVVPRLAPDGGWDLSQSLVPLRISDKSPKSDNHFDGLSGEEKAAVLKLLAECGVTLQQVREVEFARNQVNAHAFKLLSEAHPVIRFKRRQRFLFDEY